jgi:hypothetical protein
MVATRVLRTGLGELDQLCGVDARGNLRGGRILELSVDRM